MNLVENTNFDREVLQQIELKNVLIEESKRVGYSIYQLSKLTGISNVRIDAFFSGKMQYPSFLIYDVVARALNMQILVDDKVLCDEVSPDILLSQLLDRYSSEDFNRIYASLNITKDEESAFLKGIQFALQQSEKKEPDLMKRSELAQKKLLENIRQKYEVFYLDKSAKERVYFTDDAQEIGIRRATFYEYAEGRKKKPIMLYILKLCNHFQIDLKIVKK